MSPRSKARRIAQAFAPRTARRMVDRSVIGRRVGRSHLHRSPDKGRFLV